jgi:hypothetical protein
MSERVSAPGRLEPAGPGGAAYELRPDLHARHGAGAEGGGEVADFGTVRVYSGAVEGGDPVYALSGGSLAVPTGRVFVRFADGGSPRAAERQIADAGFRIEQVPAYAPNAAWVAPAGDIAAALRGVDALRAVPGVEHAEPEMLMDRHRRE